MSGNSIGITGERRTVINNTGSDIAAYIRVKQAGVKVNGVIPVSVASAADAKLGTFITQQVLSASGGRGLAMTINKGGNQIVTVNGASTAGMAIDLDDNGMYKTTIGSPVGVAEDTVADDALINATLY